MRMTSWTRACLVAAALVVARLPPSYGATEQRRPACLSEDETHKAMLSRGLIPPVRAMEAASRIASGEPIGIRLCPNDASMVYDVVVLRGDGHLVHVLVDAGSGILLPPGPGR